MSAKAPTTAAARLRRLTTTVVLLPELTARAQEPVEVLIRVLSAKEFFALTKEVPTYTMTDKELRAHLEGMTPEARREILIKAEEVTDRILALAIQDAGFVVDDEGDQGRMPVGQLGKDRAVLLRRVLEFSGLARQPGPAAAPGKPGKEGDLSPGAFRGAVAAGAGDGRAPAPDAVEAPGTLEGGLRPGPVAAPTVEPGRADRGRRRGAKARRGR